MEPNVTASQSEAKPDPFADLVRELHVVAADLSDLIGSGLPKPPHFELNIQPGADVLNADRDDDETARSVDAIAMALLGKPAEPQLMAAGDYFYLVSGQRGPIGVEIYQSISTEWVEKRQAAVVLAAKEAELAKLRAEVAELRAAAEPKTVPVHVISGGWTGGNGGSGVECVCGVTYDGFDTIDEATQLLQVHIADANADPTGLGFNREADDPTPVSPARVPLHEGAIVDGNQLVDETPKFALDAEVWVLLPSGPVPGVVVGLNRGEDYAVKTPDGRDLFGVTPSQMRPMEAWETAVVSDRLAEAIEPVADSGPEGLCWVRVPTLAGPDRPCSQPIERDPLSPSGFVHIEGGWRGHAAKPLVSDETPDYPVARCGQLSVHAPHVSDLGPDQPRNCPGHAEAQQ